MYPTLITNKLRRNKSINIIVIVEVVVDIVEVTYKIVRVTYSIVEAITIVEVPYNSPPNISPTCYYREAPP